MGTPPSASTLQRRTMQGFDSRPRAQAATGCTCIGVNTCRPILIAHGRPSGSSARRPSSVSIVGIFAHRPEPRCGHGAAIQNVAHLARLEFEADHGLSYVE